MARAKVEFLSGILSEPPIFKQGKSGDFAYFKVRIEKDSYLILCFEEDENPKSLYKKLRNMKLRGGTLLNLECYMSMKEKDVFPEKTWEEIRGYIPKNRINTLLPGGANPSKIMQPYFRLADIDFAIPQEIYEKMKEGK